VDILDQSGFEDFLSLKSTMRIGDRSEAGFPSGTESSFAGDQLIAITHRPND